MKRIIATKGYRPGTCLLTDRPVGRSAIVTLVLICMMYISLTGLSIANNPDPNNPVASTDFHGKVLKTIIVADYYPYSFVNEKGLPDGFSVDIAKAVAQVMDLKLEISVDTWENAKKALENGSIDFLPMMAYTLGIINWRVRVKKQKVSSASRDTRGPGQTGVQKLQEEVSKRTDPKGLRDKALLHLLYDLALRRPEVVGLDLEDVDIEWGTLPILGKGRLQKETLSLPTRTRKILSDWIAVRGFFEGSLFINFHHNPRIQGNRLSATSLYRIIRDLGIQTGQKVRPHGLRHTAISEPVRKVQAGVGMDVTKVLQFSRHKDLKTLQGYIDSVEDVQGKIAELVAG